MSSEAAEQLHTRGLVLRLLGKFEDAIRSYEKALSFDPDNIETLIDKGQDLDLLGRADEALDCFDHVTDIDPNHVDSWFNKGIIFLKLKIMTHPSNA